MEKNQNATTIILSLGSPIKVEGRDKYYYIKEKVEAGKLYSITCPKCGLSMFKKVQNEGFHKHICPACKTIVGFKSIATKIDAPKKSMGEVTLNAQKNEASASQKADTLKSNKEETLTKDIQEDNSNQVTPISEQQSENKETKESQIPHTHKFEVGLASGELSWGSFFSSKHFQLGENTITIGRKDKDEPSDVSLDDSYVSRRSAKIEPIIDKKGFLYKFTVLRASNPIFINNHEVKLGSSFFLNFGDTIKMGKTILTFKKSSKK